MKTLKLMSSLLIAGVIITSCKDATKNTEAKAVNLEETIQTEMKLEQEAAQMEQKRKMEVQTREYAMKDGSKISYNYTEDGVTSLKDWDNYNTLSYEMGEIAKVDYKATTERLVSMRGTIMNLDESIPDWLKTEEVMEDIADVQKEYSELMEEKNVSTDEKQENLEELNEQFSDLREELNETIDKYLEINQEAIAKFNKKMEKGKVDKAIEKFNDKMDEKEKITDYKPKK